MVSVYEQIEQLCNGPKSQRSRSFSRMDHHSGPPAHQDSSSPKDGIPLRPSLSSESTGSTPAPRSSFEKGRAMKMFRANSRSSIDRDGDSGPGLIGHRKSDSFFSENTRPISHTEPPAVVEVRSISLLVNHWWNPTMHRTRPYRESSMT
jgi:hypothetical protein